MTSQRHLDVIMISSLCQASTGCDTIWHHRRSWTLVLVYGFSPLHYLNQSWFLIKQTLMNNTMKNELIHLYKNINISNCKAIINTLLYNWWNWSCYSSLPCPPQSDSCAPAVSPHWACVSLGTHWAPAVRWCQTEAPLCHGAVADSSADAPPHVQSGLHSSHAMAGYLWNKSCWLSKTKTLQST